MPAEKRSVARESINIDYIKYWRDELDPYIGLKGEGGGSRKFHFRRDPHDIRKVWYFDPREQMYLRVYPKDKSLPQMSKWELKRAIRKVRKTLEGTGRKPNEKLIRRADKRLREIEELDWTSDTRALKRERSKRRAEENAQNIDSLTHEGGFGEDFLSEDSSGGSASSSKAPKAPVPSPPRETEKPKSTDSGGSGSNDSDGNSGGDTSGRNMAVPFD